MTDLKLNISRLKHLSDHVLARVELGGLRFDMRTWGKTGECDSAACAAGWAARDPVFQSQGLSIKNFWPNYETEKGREFCGFEALRQFFGLSRNQVYFLFDEGTYKCQYDQITPADVRARIHEVISFGDCSQGQPE